jgi:hypothetical protein
MSSDTSERFEPTTYFGVWSADKLAQVSDLLRSLGVRFYNTEDRYEQNVLQEWCAWDPSAADPYLGYDLWIHSDDLEKVGYKIVDKFPERKFEPTS